MNVKNIPLSDFELFVRWPGTLRVLNAWKVVTVGDLAGVGMTCGLPDRPDMGLLDLRGIGTVKVNAIRAFLYGFDLELMDEQAWKDSPWASS